MDLPKLGVNIDHIATLRELRGTPYPNLLEAAKAVQEGGAHQITVHLREDRRHIQDQDVYDLCRTRLLDINLEMAVSEPITKIALKARPNWACLVPEKRQELTTEGGLNLKKNTPTIARCISKLQKAGIRVSLFIEPSLESVKLAKKLGADAVELHTGRYCLVSQNPRKHAQIPKELRRLEQAGELSKSLGLGTHAGHGFDLDNVRAVARLDIFSEYNIGHSIVCRASLVGLRTAVSEMLAAVCNP